MQATYPRPRLAKNYRVPGELRAIKHEAYTPRMFLIGPLHRDKSELQTMEKEKRRYVLDFFDRVAEQDKERNQNNGSSENLGQTLARDKCHEVVSVLEEEARQWYTEDIDLDKHQLVEMLVRDGCFILELFYKCELVSIQKSTDQYHPVDPLSSNLRILQTLRNDFMLLENQIPFVVLQKLFDLIPQKASIFHPEMSLEEHIFWFFNTVPMLQYNISNSKDGTYRHLLDMLHHVCDVTSKKSPPTISSNDSHLGFRRCATELYKSGVQIVCDHNRAMVDIKFNEGEISMPQVIIDKSSETLLRNLIALEQVSCVGHSVTSYVKVMDSLIRSPKDADLLESLGIIIIKSDVGTNAPDFFHSLCREVVFGNFSLSELCKEVNDYHIPVWRWRRIKGYFRIRYVEWKESIAHLKFSDLPSSVFLLQSLQTLYAVFSYYNFSNH